MMYFLLTITCLLLAVDVNGLQMFFEDDASYNPCQHGSNIYFYPDPTDPSKYYQCDEFGNAYSRSCGNLVWDEIRVACNWPAAVAPQLPQIASISNTSTTTLPSTTAQTQSTTIATEVSLCKPTNPCGEHGQCLESPETVPRSRQRFACICSENWFGRLCDQQTDELTTPGMNFDQGSNLSQIIHTFSLPVLTEKDSKYIFYGLKETNRIGLYTELQHRTMDSHSTEEDEVPPGVEDPTSMKTIS